MSFVLTHERRGGARRTHGEVVEHQTLAVTKQLHRCFSYQNQKIYDLTHNSKIYDGVSGRGVGLTFIPSMLPSTTLTSQVVVYMYGGALLAC